MKNLLKSLGFLGIVIAIISAMYGSVKMARANDDGGVELAIYEKQKSAAQKAFSAAGLLFVGGVVLIFISRKSK